MHSSGTWTTAVDPTEPHTQVTAASEPHFVSGVCAGILVAAVAAQLWLASHLEALSHFVLEGVELRSLTRLAVSPLWRYGVPGAFAAVLVLLLVLRVRAVAVWTVVAAAAVATLVLTHIWAFGALD
jgi:hypothetical protein